MLILIKWLNYVTWCAIFASVFGDVVICPMYFVNEKLKGSKIMAKYPFNRGIFNRSVPRICKNLG